MTKTQQLPIGFREPEARRIFQWIEAGASCSVVGVSGMGKSNLFRHLLDPDAQQTYLGKRWRDYLFVEANFHALPSLTERGIFNLLLQGLTEIGEPVGGPQISPSVVAEIGEAQSRLLEAGEDSLAIQHHFRSAIRLLMAVPERHLVFLLDQFDEVCQQGPARALANLRGLRESYKYRVSYVVFTRRTLPRLCDGPEMDEFYELVAPNVLGLQPYSEKDARLLLQRVSERYDLEVSVRESDRLISLSGGHPGLLKAAFLAVAQDGVVLPGQDSDTLDTLLGVPNVAEECAKLWGSVDSDEQIMLARCELGLELPPTTGEAEQLLRLKGLLIKADSGALQVFAPLFGAYVLQQGGPWQESVYLDQGTGRVWVLGELVTPELSRLEFRLLEALLERRGEVCSRDHLLQRVYADEYEQTEGGLDDDRLNQLVRRLRNRIEPVPHKPRFLETVRGRGFRLLVDPPE